MGDSAIEIILRFLGQNESAKQSSTELREKISADLTAITAESKANSAQITTATKEASTVSVAAVSNIRSEVRSTGLEFAQTARLASSAGRGIENLFRGNLLGALRNFSIASRTAFNPNGPLAYGQAIQAVSVEAQQAQSIVAAFSSILGSAAKNAEGALNKTLLNDFGISAEKALLNPSLAAQKFVSSLAEVGSAEERAAMVAGIFGAQTGKILPLIESQIALQQQQVAALAALQAAEERNAAAQAALTAETEAATGVITGDVLATQGLATAEAEATAAAEALTAAEAELATVQEGLTASTAEQTAASGLSLGTWGLIALAVAAVTYGIYKLLTAQEEVIVVTKDQIDITERRVAQARIELELAERMKAATDDEKQTRQALIEAKQQELQISQELLQTQQYAVDHALVVALQNQEKAQRDLTKAEDAERESSVLRAAESVIKTDIISKENEALGKSQETTKKAAEAANLFAEATGKSTLEVYEAIAATIRQTHSKSEAIQLETDLAHALGLTIDAEGHLVPATDDATVALRRQIGALADLTTEANKANKALEQIAQAQDARIQERINAIVAIARGNLQTAREMARRSLQEPGIGEDIKEQRGDKATRKAVEDLFFPRDKKQASEAEKARKDQERTLSEQLRGIEDAYKHQTDTLQREYKLQLINLDDFVQKSIDAENERYEKTKAALEKQQALAKPGTSEYTKYTRELQEAERKHTDDIQKINDEADQKRLDSLRKHQEELLKLQQDYVNRSATSLREAANAGGITYEEAEQRILKIQTDAFDRRLEILTAEEKRYWNNAEEFRRVNDEIKKITEDQIAFQEEAERRIEDARQKDIDNLLTVTNTVYKTELEYEQLARDSYRRQLNDYSQWAARHILITNQTRAKLIYLQASYDQEEEAARHAKEMRRLAAEEADMERLLKATKATEEELLKLHKIYDSYKEQETQRHIDEQNRINREADKATKEATGQSEGGILGGIKEDFNNIPDLKPAEAAANAVTLAYKNMKQAVLDSIDAFIFYGESIGQVMRKAVAETLAGIAKEAAIQGIKQSALALAALATWDLRGFALHSAAAAAWFSITAGSALLGRSVMGSSLQQNQGGGGAGAGSNADNNAPQYAPFNYGGSANFSASQAGAPGSRTGSVLLNVLNRIADGQDRIANGQVQIVTASLDVANNVAALHDKIDSIPGDDLIRKNPYAVADGLERAVQSGHEIRKTMTALGSTGLA